jgi:hypothetical protein
MTCIDRCSENLAMQPSHALSSNVDGFPTGFASQTELITLGKRTYEQVLDIKKTPELRERYAFLKVRPSRTLRPLVTCPLRPKINHTLNLIHLP